MIDQTDPGTSLDVERFFKLDILEPAKPGNVEPVIMEGEQDGQLWFVYSDLPQKTLIRFRASNDAGRTWPEGWTAQDAASRDIRGFHISVMRLQSGRLGMVYSVANEEYGHPGREEGRTPGGPAYDRGIGNPGRG